MADEMHDLRHPVHGMQSADADAFAIDPICGMKVDPEKPAATAEFQGKLFYFCSRGCHAKFTADPGPFAGKTTPVPQAKPAPPGAIFTCPMHPEVRQVGPGACPKCGMALEPETVSADAGPNLELIDMTRRFWVGLVLTLPVFILAMAAHVPGFHVENLVSPAAS